MCRMASGITIPLWNILKLCILSFSGKIRPLSQRLAHVLTPLKKSGIPLEDPNDPVRSLFQGTLMWPMSYFKKKYGACNILEGPALSE